MRPGTALTSAGADAAAFLEQEAGSIPLMLAEECGKMAATFAIAAPAKLGAGGGDGDGNAMAMMDADNENGNDDGTPAKPPPPPADFEIPQTDIMRAADLVDAATAGPAGVRALPPLGFPVWSQRWPVGTVE